MKKIISNYKFTIVLSLAILAMVTFLTVNFNEPIASNWNMQGLVTGYSPPYTLYLLFPLMWAVEFMNKIKTNLITEDFKEKFTRALQIFMLLITAYILLYNMEYKFDFRWAILSIGIFSIGTAVLLVNGKKNKTR